MKGPAEIIGITEQVIPVGGQGAYAKRGEINLLADRCPRRESEIPDKASGEREGVLILRQYDDAEMVCLHFLDETSGFPSQIPVETIGHVGGRTARRSAHFAVFIKIFLF